MRLTALLACLVLTACQTGPRPTASNPSGPPRPGTAAPTSDADEQLRRAAWANDVDAARTLIEAGADVNAKDATEQSAYLIATSEGHANLLDLTLAHGARVGDLDSWNGTGLIRAAERGHWLVVGKLLAAGIDRDHVNRIGYQAIHEAIWLGRDTDAYVATVRVLAAAGVQVDRASGQEGLTPVSMAERRGHGRQLTALRAILDASAPPPSADTSTTCAGSSAPASTSTTSTTSAGQPCSRP